jgi:mitotic spindle assembly checkpoint protein MAD2
VNSATVTADEQVRTYIKKIMSQLNRWMADNTISKLVVVISSKETGEPVERWQFDVSATSTCFCNLSLLFSF